MSNQEMLSSMVPEFRRKIRSISEIRLELTPYSTYNLCLGGHRVLGHNHIDKPRDP